MSNKRLVSRLYKELLKLNSLKNIHTKKQRKQNKQQQKPTEKNSIRK